MGIIKGFTFDGINSLDYGLGITGSAVYNAPTRDVEMIVIPGRDGEFALDHGRFNNIEVTYPAGAFDTDQQGFAEKIHDLRNQLASRVGYKRLEDEYNPNEYRMAIYKSGLDVSPVHYGRAGQFDVIFDCKPQRWLKSGEIQVPLSLLFENPTLYPAKPLLAVWGEGTIVMNGYTITLTDEEVGDVILTEAGRGRPSYTATYQDGLMNTGDTIDVDGGSTISVSLTISPTPTAVSVTNGGNTARGTASIVGSNIGLDITFARMSFTTGTDRNQGNAVTLNVTTSSGTTAITFNPKVVYDATARSFTIRLDYSTLPEIVARHSIESALAQTVGHSTVHALGDPSYIDCEIGEAYKYVNGEIVAINSAVSMGGELPELSPGINEISKDYTILNVEITPRWWTI